MSAVTGAKGILELVTASLSMLIRVAVTNLVVTRHPDRSFPSRGPGQVTPFPWASIYSSVERGHCALLEGS